MFRKLSTFAPYKPTPSQFNSAIDYLKKKIAAHQRAHEEYLKTLKDLNEDSEKNSLAIRAKIGELALLEGEIIAKKNKEAIEQDKPPPHPLEWNPPYHEDHGGSWNGPGY